METDLLANVVASHLTTKIGIGKNKKTKKKKVFLSKTTGPNKGSPSAIKSSRVTILAGPHRLGERVTSDVTAGLTPRKGDSGSEEGKKEKAANISYCDSGEELPGVKGRGAGFPGGGGETTGGHATGATINTTRGTASPKALFSKGGRSKSRTRKHKAEALGWDPASSLGVEPEKVFCPDCHTNVVTETYDVYDNSTYFSAFSLAVMGLCLIAWVPFCLDRFQSVEHTCPRCHRSFGKYKDTEFNKQE